MPTSAWGPLECGGSTPLWLPAERSDIRHVPARVCQETGEQYFAPETVERIQALIKGERRPDRVVETPVFEYAR